MKTLLSAVLLANGLFLSSLALADDAQPVKTETSAPAEAAPQADSTTSAQPAAATETTKKMTKMEAEKACKDDGKTGAQLKSCVKEKMGE